MEVDDEYWENEQDPEQAFKQPPRKPSRIFCLFRRAQSNFSCRVEVHRESQVYHVFCNFEAHGPWRFTVFIQQIEAFPWLCGSALGAAHCGLRSLPGSSSS